MFEIRTITPDDAELFRRRMARGFGGDAETDAAAVERFDAIFEYDRTFAAFDGDDIIGTGAGFSLGLTVPGGAEVPMGGTTVITVQPTHRRRGVLRSLMDHHFEDVAEHAEPLAGLWASESSIYGRFGYGQATFRHVASMSVSGVDFGRGLAKGSVRLVEADEAEPILRSVYEEARPTRAGMLTRSDAWWTHRRMADPEAEREGMSARRYLIHEEDGVVTGYATYRQKSKWEDSFADGTVDVIEVFATTSTAHSGIWSFLTNVDLFPNVEWRNMPLDDPLPFKITNPRRVVRKMSDGLWVRVMDIPVAMSARRYDYDGHLVFGVEDRARPDNTGTYRLEVSDGVGHCERVSGAGEVVVDIDVLGHLYLGGGDALGMAAAGRIEGDPGAVRRLHRIMRTDQQPWCPEVF